MLDLRSEVALAPIADVPLQHEVAVPEGFGHNVLYGAKWP